MVQIDPDRSLIGKSAFCLRPKSYAPYICQSKYFLQSSWLRILISLRINIFTKKRRHLLSKFTPAIQN